MTSPYNSRFLMVHSDRFLARGGENPGFTLVGGLVVLAI
jgi:hypothetical protein